MPRFCERPALRCVAALLVAGLVGVSASAEPVTWQISEVFPSGGSDVLWGSPSSVPLDQASYNYSYEITEIGAFAGGVLTPFDRTDAFAASLALSGSGSEAALPFAMVDGLLNDPSSATSLGLSLSVDSSGFGRAAFTNITLGQLDLGFGNELVDIDFLRIQATITVDPVPPFIPGDYNGDDVVDGDDYTLWSVTLGSTVVLAADGNSDGVVDAADYTIWRDALGAGSAAAGIPEPATAWGAAFYALTLCRGGRRQSARSV